MNTIRISLLAWLIMGIGALQAKDCVTWGYLRIDRGDGGIETASPAYGNAQVFVIGPGQSAEYVFESNAINECYSTLLGPVSNSVLKLNGNVIYDQPLEAEVHVPLTQAGYYEPTFGGSTGTAYSIGGDAPFFLSFSGPSPLITLSVKVWLDGPYNSGTQLMNDALRANGLIPLVDNTSTITPSVLNVTGANAIVDRVSVSIKRNGIVLRSWTALLQRDGDVVGTDGMSPLTFDLPTGDYNVMVRHRNHLGCVTAPIAFTANTTVDLRDPNTITLGTDARKVVGNTRTLWPGSTGASITEYPKRISYTGANNDRDPILTRIGGSVPTAAVTGYFHEDVNMDGVVKYTGSGNDRDPVLTTIGGTVPTNTRNAQLP